MPSMEIDETKFQSMDRVVKTVAQIMQDPKRRQKLLELQKEADPNTVIPEVDATKAVTEVADGMRKDMADFRKELSESREKDENERKLAEFTKRHEAGRSMLRQRGYNDDGITAVEKLMADRGISDHEDGMTVFERINPPQTPVTPSGFGSLTFLEKAKQPGDDNLSKLMASRGQDETSLNRLIDGSLRDYRNGVVG